MATPPWLREVLVVVGRTGIKAVRHGMREGAANAIDSVLEDVQGLTDEISRRVRDGRSTLRGNARRAAKKDRKPPERRSEPEVIDAVIEEEE